ncbi:hypothetical protein WJX72_007005 [[Myrmecia] bisecta]|uniref:Uncharacterized protein n=1 Tax=[Myrmecia] bisecta TaxID=41462 RepID=A0AAW1Q5W2_9CHLO
MVLMLITVLQQPVRSMRVYGGKRADKTFGLWGEHEKTLYSCMQTAIVHKGVRHKELEEARNAGTLNELILEKYPDIAQSPYGRAAKACGGFKAPDGRSIDQMYAWANEDAA